MATYEEAPTISVSSVLGNAATTTPGLTDDLLLSAADSCGLLGTAQGFVNETAAAATKAADQAINATIESAGNITKRVKDYASSEAGSAGEALSNTFAKVNDYIQYLFDNADVDPVTGERSSLELDQYLDSISSAVNSIQGVFSSAGNLVATAVSNVNTFLNGDPEGTGFISDVVSVANDLRILTCEGANTALTAVGTGVTAAVDSLSGPLGEGKTPDQIIKEKHSAGIEAKATAAASTATNVNDGAATTVGGLDNEVPNKLAELETLTPEVPS